MALYYWMSPTRPAIRTGDAATAPANLTYSRKTVQSPGVILSIPAGGLHTLRLSYFRTRGTGNTTAGENSALFAVGMSPGDYVSLGYTLENAKVSFDFLSWPFPLKNSQRFRIKTLWEVQYTAVTTTLDVPFKVITDAEGNQLTDDSGNPVYKDGKGKSWFVYPTLGMGIEHSLTHNLRWEAKASGFAFPGRAAIWDADVMLAFRKGPIEVMAGAKGFHYKTSPKQEYFVKSTLSGGFVGLRWYLK